MQNPDEPSGVSTTEHILRNYYQSIYKLEEYLHVLIATNRGDSPPPFLPSAQDSPEYHQLLRKTIVEELERLQRILALDVLEHSGDGVWHILLTVVLRYFFPGRTPDFYSTNRRSLESNEIFVLYLIQCGEREEDYSTRKEMADKFEAIIGALFEESGFDGVVEFMMRAFGPMMYAAVDAYNKARPSSYLPPRFKRSDQVFSDWIACDKPPLFEFMRHTNYVQFCQDACLLASPYFLQRRDTIQKSNASSSPAAPSSAATSSQTATPATATPPTATPSNVTPPTAASSSNAKPHAASKRLDKAPSSSTDPHLEPARFVAKRPVPLSYSSNGKRSKRSKTNHVANNISSLDTQVRGSMLLETSSSGRSTSVLAAPISSSSLKHDSDVTLSAKRIQSSAFLTSTPHSQVKQVEQSRRAIHKATSSALPTEPSASSKPSTSSHSTVSIQRQLLNPEPSSHRRSTSRSDLSSSGSYKHIKMTRTLTSDYINRAAVSQSPAPRLGPSPSILTAPRLSGDLRLIDRIERGSSASSSSTSLQSKSVEQSRVGRTHRSTVSSSMPKPDTFSPTMSTDAGDPQAATGSHARKHVADPPGSARRIPLSSSKPSANTLLASATLEKENASSAGSDSVVKPAIVRSSTSNRVSGSGSSPTARNVMPHGRLFASAVASLPLVAEATGSKLAPRGWEPVPPAQQMALGKPSGEQVTPAPCLLQHPHEKENVPTQASKTIPHAQTGSSGSDEVHASKSQSLFRKRVLGTHRGTSRRLRSLGDQDDQER